MIYCAWASWTSHFQGLFREHQVLPLHKPEIPKDAKLIIFPGGEDINPQLYTNEKLRIHYSPRRDDHEITIFKEARKRNLPIFGVCRGHQLINVLLGGKLIPDLPTEGIFHAGGHTVTWRPEWDEFNLPTVNSLHHQGYSVDMRAPSIYPIGVYQGVVEAAVSENIFTVQFHPEMMDVNKVVNLKNYVLSMIK